MGSDEPTRIANCSQDRTDKVSPCQVTSKMSAVGRDESVDVEKAESHPQTYFDT